MLFAIHIGPGHPTVEGFMFVAGVMILMLPLAISIVVWIDGRRK
jgi:hypothetical protein